MRATSWHASRAKLGCESLAFTSFAALARDHSARITARQ
jgi:hypothetical protein